MVPPFCSILRLGSCIEERCQECQLHPACVCAYLSVCLSRSACVCVSLCVYLCFLPPPSQFFFSSFFYFLAALIEVDVIVAASCRVERRVTLFPGCSHIRVVKVLCSERFGATSARACGSNRFQGCARAPSETPASLEREKYTLWSIRRHCCGRLFERTRSGSNGHPIGLTPARI